MLNVTKKVFDELCMSAFKLELMVIYDSENYTKAVVNVKVKYNIP